MSTRHCKPTGPLDGVTVVELGGFIAGPFAGQLLGDLGARVIKIEAPTGDPMRHWGVEKNGESLWWPAIARNKESVVLDFKQEDDRRAAADLLARVDVVVENFAPGRLHSWGLDYATIAARNPGLIMAHVSGFGQTGPRARDRGFGSVAEAMGGLRALAGYPDRPPVRYGVSMGDSLAALFAVNGVLAALHERSRSGRGQEIDVALYEASFALTESLLADHVLGGVTRSRTGSTLPGVAPSNVYTASDGMEILIAANSDSLANRLFTAMGSPELADDPRFSTHQARGLHMAELDAIIGAWAATLPGHELERLLDEQAIPRGRVYTPDDILQDEQYAAREMVLRVEAPGHDQPVPMPGVVPRLSRTPGRVRSSGPRLGEHTDAVRSEFGLR